MLSSLRQLKPDRTASRADSVEAEGILRTKATRSKPTPPRPRISCLSDNASSNRPCDSSRRPGSALSTTSSFSSFASLSPSQLIFPSPLQRHRASLTRRPTSPPRPDTMATLVVSPPSPSPLMSPAAAAYASKARCDSPSPSSSGQSKTSRIFRRVVSRTPFSSTNNTPALTSSPFSPTYSLVSTPVETDVEVLAPCVAPTEETEKKVVVKRRLSRKPVPSSPELEGEAVFQAATEQQRRKKRARPSPQPAEVVDGLWTSTCDARPDDLDFPSFSPLLHSRRSSSASSASTSTSYDSPLPPAVADLAILLSTSARRASIPSPAALAGNAALSPRLARIAAFTSTVTQLDGGIQQGAGGEVEKAAKEHAKRLRNSFDLPEIELPWLPTLFPEGTPFASTSTSSAFLAPPARSIGSSPPSSPAMSNASSTLLYPLSLHSSGSSSSASSSSSSSSCGSSHLSSSSTATNSTLLTPPPSLHHFPSSSRSSSSPNRKSMFRITTASGAQLILDLPYTSTSPSLVPPSSPCPSSSPSPRLPSLDFSPFLPHRRASSSDEWSDAPSSTSPAAAAAKDWNVEDKGVSTSWVERDEEDEDGEGGGEVLVIALTSKLG